MSIEQVTLRPVVEADLPRLFAQQCDPVASQLAAFTPRERTAFWEHWHKILADETVIKRTISLAGAAIGSVVSFERDGRRQVGYWLDRAYWGQGILSVMLSQFLALDPTRPLWAWVAKHNIGSCRVLEKNGFIVVARQSVPWGADGALLDEILYRLDPSHDLSHARIER